MKIKNVKICQFLGQQHSWSVFGWGIATSLLKLGHEVHLFPTDGIKHIPFGLKNKVSLFTKGEI